MKKKKYKLDLFKLLDNITEGNIDYINQLSEEELKEFSPHVITMWLKNANVNKEVRLMLLNAQLNPYLHSLGTHKKLLYQLMCCASGLNDSARYSFPRKKV